MEKIPYTVYFSLSFIILLTFTEAIFLNPCTESLLMISKIILFQINRGIRYWVPYSSLLIRCGLFPRHLIFFNRRQNEKMSRNQAKLYRARNIDICFCAVFDHYYQSFFLAGRLRSRLSLHPFSSFYRNFQIFYVFLKYPKS